MINTLILKDYFSRNHLILVIGALTAFALFFFSFFSPFAGFDYATPLVRSLYVRAFILAFYGSLFFFRNRGEMRVLATLPVNSKTRTNTLFFIAVIIFPLLGFAFLMFGSFPVKILSGSWSISIIHVPLFLLAGIASGGTLLWLMIHLNPAIIVILIALLLPISPRDTFLDDLPMPAGMALISLGLALAFLAWQQMPSLCGPSSLQKLGKTSLNLKRVVLKPYSPSMESFLFGAMLSAVFAAVALWGVWQQDLKIENAGETFTANQGMLLMIAPMLSIGIVWRWGSAIRALRALPLSSWGIVWIYIRILSATILGLLIWMGMVAVVFQNFSAMKYLLLYSLLMFFAGMLLCSLHLRWQLKGTLAGALFFYTWAFVMITQGVLSPRSSTGYFFHSSLLATASTLLLLTALCCYWLYRLIAYNSSVYRCAGYGNTRL